MIEKRDHVPAYVKLHFQQGEAMKKEERQRRTKGKKMKRGKE